MVVKNGGAVLGADVGPLLVKRGGVVGGPEDIEKDGIGNDMRIKGNLDGFGVAGGAGRDGVVVRIFYGTACISGDG